MSDFFNGFGFGLAMSTRFSMFNNCYGYGFGCIPYDGVPSTGYLQTCYLDLDQPSGLNSVVDGGWAVNGIYRNTFNFSPYATSAGYGFGGFGLGGFGFGGYGLGGFGFGGFYC